MSTTIQNSDQHTTGSAADGRAALAPVSNGNATMTKIPNQRINLISQEGDNFEVSYSAMSISEFIMTEIAATLIEAKKNDQHEITFPTITSATLVRIIDFCRHHHLDPMKKIKTPLRSTDLDDLIDDWYVEFAAMDEKQLIDVTLAAHILGIKPLLSLMCAQLALLIQEKPVEEIRQLFDILNDFSPEEEAQLQEENAQVA